MPAGAKAVAMSVRYRYAAAIHMTVLDVGAVEVLGPAGARGYDIAMRAKRDGGTAAKRLRTMRLVAVIMPCGAAMRGRDGSTANPSASSRCGLFRVGSAVARRVVGGCTSSASSAAAGCVRLHVSADPASALEGFKASAKASPSVGRSAGARWCQAASDGSAGRSWAFAGDVGCTNGASSARSSAKTRPPDVVDVRHSRSNERLRLEIEHDDVGIEPRGELPIDHPCP